MKDIAKIQRQLLRKKGVSMVGLGTKKVAGQDTGEVAIVVGVKQKLPLSALAAKDRVPGKIKGVKTDIVETGELRLL